MVSPIIGTSAANAQAFCRRTSAAARLGAAERTGLAVQALAGSEPIARLADRHDVSRKFVYQQKAKATETLEQAFAGILDERFAEVAERLKVPLPRVHAVCEWLGTDPNTPAHWQQHGRLCRVLGSKFHQAEQAVRDILAETPRASSIIENLNSRLRNYFFLRRHIGDAYLDLLRFFLNHRRFLRSECPQRVGKSPAELLTGQPHRHWLEFLGHQRFHRN